MSMSRSEKLDELRTEIGERRLLKSADDFKSWERTGLVRSQRILVRHGITSREALKARYDSLRDLPGIGATYAHYLGMALLLEDHAEFYRLLPQLQAQAQVQPTTTEEGFRLGMIAVTKEGTRHEQE